MAVVYVREQGAIVRKHGGRMLVEKQGELLLEIPLRKTECVSIFGNVQVTTQALSELLDRGIPLALFTRNGRLKGRLVPELSKNTALRLAQYAAALDEGKSLALARPLVRAKLLNSLTLVSNYRTHYSSDTLAAVGDALRRAADDAAAATSHAVLLGCEGAGAATYFRALAEMNRSELPFDGREKHPATDPINALLSLGYALVMNELRGLAEASGLEPHLGFLAQGGLRPAIFGIGPSGAVSGRWRGPANAALGERAHADRRRLRDTRCRPIGRQRCPDAGILPPLPAVLRGSHDPTAQVRSRGLARRSAQFRRGPDRIPARRDRILTLRGDRLMLYLISYDISDDDRRCRVSEALKDFGRRVQFSVFECDVDEAGLRELSARIDFEIDGSTDSCRFYRLCKAYAAEVQILGKGDRYSEPSFVIV
jgi:CRISPR-associated endonuclease Cas2